MKLVQTKIVKKKVELKQVQQSQWWIQTLKTQFCFCFVVGQIVLLFQKQKEVLLDFSLLKFFVVRLIDIIISFKTLTKMSSLQDELSSIDENDGKPNENTMNSFLQLSQFEAPKNVQLFDELGQNTFPPHHICLEVISAQKGEVKGQSLSEINFFSFPDHDQLDYIQPVFIAQQIKAQTQQRYQTKKKTCKCKKSNCMKDYCECYQYGEICSPHTCGCENCFNIVQNETLSQKRRRYQQKQNNYSYRICTCRRNQCSSKHCQCKRNGKHCGPQCQCVGCSNQSIAKEGKREVTQQIRKLRKAKISAKF